VWFAQNNTETQNFITIYTAAGHMDRHDKEYGQNNKEKTKGLMIVQNT